MGGAGRRVGVEVRVGLATVMGLDDRCGEVAGLGPVLPDAARVLVGGQHRGAHWRFAVTDTQGRLILAGTTRRRPAIADLRRGDCRGGVVELHVSADDLARLVGHAGPWAAVVADVARQYADRDDALVQLDGRPTARFARAALARHVEGRDRTCCFPGCRRSARKSDKDHTQDHSRGGPTVRCNVGPLCDRHHRYKTEGGWVLRQPEPGRFRWTRPLGRVYRTRGEPISPPSPPQHPRPADADPDSGSGRRIAGPTFPRPARYSRPHRPPRSDDGPPPF